MRSVLAVLTLVVVALITSLAISAASSSVTYIPADQVNAAFAKGAVLVNNGNYMVHASWRDTEGQITHFVSSMGTTGTIMGVSRYLKERNARIQIIGAQPSEGSNIPGIRKWPEAYLPKIYERPRVDELIEVSQTDAEEFTRRMAREEGIFAGISSGGAMWVALEVAAKVKNAVIVTIICDRGDRYLSTGVFPD